MSIGKSSLRLLWWNCYLCELRSKITLCPCYAMYVRICQYFHWSYLHIFITQEKNRNLWFASSLCCTKKLWNSLLLLLFCSYVPTTCSVLSDLKELRTMPFMLHQVICNQFEHTDNIFTKKIRYLSIYRAIMHMYTCVTGCQYNPNRSIYNIWTE